MRYNTQWFKIINLDRKITTSISIRWTGEEEGKGKKRGPEDHNFLRSSPTKKEKIMHHLLQNIKKKGGTNHKYKGRRHVALQPVHNGEKGERGGKNMVHCMRTKPRLCHESCQKRKRKVAKQWGGEE